MENENRERHSIKVILTIDVIDFDGQNLPKSENGLLTWTPEACIIDYINHFIKMDEDSIWESTVTDLEEVNRDYIFPEELIKKTTKIFLDNAWSVDKDKVIEEYGTYENALDKLTKELVNNYCKEEEDKQC